MCGGSGIEIRAEGDFGPHTKVRLTEWIENVPVKDLDGRVIGRATVSDKGEIKAVIDEKEVSKELFDILRIGIGDSLSIQTVSTPVIRYSDEVRARLAEQNPFKKKEEGS